MIFKNKIKKNKKFEIIAAGITIILLASISSIPLSEAGGPEPPAPTTLKITKLTSFGDDTFDFIVTGPTSFNPSIITVGGVGIDGPTIVIPGTYSVQETIPVGWDLTTASCNDGSSTFSIDTVSGIVINLEDQIECTFENIVSGLSEPDQVTGLVVTENGLTTIDLVWNTPFDGGLPITGYKIERESPIGGGFAVLVADTGSTATTFENTGLVHSTQYNYRVSATNALGTGLASSEADATTFTPTFALSDQASCEVAPFFGTWDGPTGTCIITDLTINAGDTLQIDNTATLNVTGTFGNFGIVTADGRINILGTFNNEGNVTTNQINISGTFNNRGTSTGLDVFEVEGGVFNNFSTVFNENGCTLVSFSGGTINNHGEIFNQNAGTIEAGIGGTINNYGTISNVDPLVFIGTNTAGVFNNFGTINNVASSEIISRGTFNNSGIINNSGGTIDIIGTLNNSNLINNVGGLINNSVTGTIDNQGVICGNTFNNSGTFTGSSFEASCVLGTLKITKLTTGGDDSFNFTTTGPTGFNATITTNSGTGMNAQNVTAGTYSVQEIGIPSGWTLTTASCNDGFSSFSVDTISGIVLAADDEIICTFENQIALSPDTDGDGIFNEIDDFPNSVSDDFSDIPLGGTTDGTILDRADQILTVTEEANPLGVRVKADISGGVTPADVEFCSGMATISFDPGDESVQTCSSVTITVINGQLAITFFATDGTEATTSLTSGNSITFDQDIFSFTAPATNTETIIIDVEGTPITIGPGDTNTSQPEVGTIITSLDPLQAGTLVEASATFTDLGPLETHTAEWDWGDLTTSSGVVTENGLSGTVTGSHTYSTPGVYTVTLTVTDDTGDSGSSIFQFVVIFDPSDGFVTGGGWIDSPTGAYVADPLLVGKATFGFVSKYQNGANVPTGNTQFSFKVADLKFKSTENDWLVVAGSNAKFKGTGTINGQGNYGFQLFGFDADVNTNDSHLDDKFRIKIWDKNNGDIVVYDNELGQSDDAEPSTIIGGGSIVIHKP